MKKKAQVEEQKQPVKRARKVHVATEDDFEPVNKWWEKSFDQSGDDDEVRWTSLEHHGMLFAPPYESHQKPLVYDGEQVQLNSEAEELATFFAQTLHMDWCNKARFRHNFFKEFVQKLSPELRTKIVSMDKCDFSLIRAFLDEQSAQKKAMSKQEKDKISEAKRVAEKPFTHAIVNGIREKVANCRVEPPNLFRGRGEHPKMGLLKKRIVPEDVSINIGPDDPVPPCNATAPGHAYADVVHDGRVTWLAWYKDSINGNFKYMFLHASSGFKGFSDFEKYEKARKLKKYIKRIRADYEGKLVAKEKLNRQIGTVAYLIDRLALRVGNEKDTDEEADTVGCCSLRVEHIRFEKAEEGAKTSPITLDFLGKDSIRFINTVHVATVVYNNLQSFCKGKEPGDPIFDVDPDDINKFFKGFMPELSAKVFRTYNASVTLESELCRLTGGVFNRPLVEKIGQLSAPNGAPAVTSGSALDGSSVDAASARDVIHFDVEDFFKVYNEANRQVAILCNHQRAVPKSHEAAMLKMKGAADEVNSAIQALELLAGGTKASKLGAEKTEALSKMGIAVDKLKPDQVSKKLTQLKVKAMKMESNMDEKEDNKTVSLTTSKINYMDPRITVAFCKSVELPIEKVFSKTIRNKFPWAMHAASTWAF